MHVEENTYWARNGKHQNRIKDFTKLIPRSGEAESEEVEALRVAVNAYYDYYNNGGCNRFRLDDLTKIKLKRGSKGSKAVSKLKTYRTKESLSNYMPDNLGHYYEDMMNAVIEEYFLKE